MRKKNFLSKLINKEKKRQEKSINLIASENITSRRIMKENGNILTNKYAEGLPGKRYYGGCKIIDIIESISIEYVKKIFNASWANVQPHSGSQANAAVMLAILKPGDKILGFNLSHGGHLTHGSSVNFSGKLYHSYSYKVSEKTKLIDYKEVEKIAKREKPKLIICGASSYTRDWDYKKFKKIANDIGSFLMADISHTSGFILNRLLNNPINYCDFITSTTQKTLRGPRGGIILMGKDSIYKNKKISEIIDKGVFPGTQGGPLENTISAKAISFKDTLNKKYSNYVINTKINASEISKSLIKKKYNIITNGTDNHIILIDLKNKKINGKVAEDSLAKADIIVNKNMIPFDSNPPNITSGIRIGTSSITSQGMKKENMNKIAELIDEVIVNHKNKKIIKKVKKKVNEFMKKFK